MPLIAVAVAFSVGILVGIKVPLPEIAFVWLIFGCALGLLWRDVAPIRAICFLVIAFSAGILRQNLIPLANDPAAIVLSEGPGSITVRGKVVESLGNNGSILVASLDSSYSLEEATWLPLKADVLIYISPYPTYNVGDGLELTGRFERIDNLDDGTFKVYLERHRVQAITRYPTIKMLQKADAGPFLQALTDLRSLFATTLSQHLPEPHASIAQGLLLGQRRNLSADLNQAFKKTGTSHVLAISGFNITLIISFTAALGRLFFGRRTTTFVTLATILIFVALVGPSPSVVRATVMGILVVLARMFGRQTNSLHFLALAALGMLMFDPSVLDDIGFQLSFAATVGLLLVAPLVEEQLLVWTSARSTNSPAVIQALIRAICENTAITLAATIATLPILARYFQAIPLVSPIANLIVLPLPGLIIGSSMLMILSDTLVPILTPIVAVVVYVLSSIMVGAVRVCSAVDFTYLQSMGPDDLTLFLYYLTLISIVVLIKLNDTPFRKASSKVSLVSIIGRMVLTSATLLQNGVSSRLLVMIPFLIGGLTLSVVTVSLSPTKDYSVSFLDVGQGEAILVRTIEGKAILIDGGPESESLIRELDSRLPFFKRRIDLIILTHPHEDHLGGLFGALERYEVGVVIEGTGRGDTAIYREWENLLKEKGVQKFRVTPGYELDLDAGSRLAFLGSSSPPAPGRQSQNQSSLVTKIEIGNVSFLLPSDVDAGIQKELSKSTPDLHTSVLLVPHHGAEAALDKDFLEATNPQLAIISVGKDNQYGHPSPVTLSLLETRQVKVLRTDVAGSVDLLVRDDIFSCTK